MAGIDNNTLLYLRGDSFNDLGPKSKAITAIGCTLDSSTKSINATSGLHILATSLRMLRHLRPKHGLK